MRPQIPPTALPFSLSLRERAGVRGTSAQLIPLCPPENFPSPPPSPISPCPCSRFRTPASPPPARKWSPPSPMQTPVSQDATWISVNRMSRKSSARSSSRSHSPIDTFSIPSSPSPPNPFAPPARQCWKRCHSPAGNPRNDNNLPARSPPNTAGVSRRTNTPLQNSSFT